MSEGILAQDGEGMGVDVIVEVAVAGDTDISEDELEEGDVEDSSAEDELEAVLVVVPLIDVEIRMELEDVAVLEMEVDKLEAVLVIVSLMEVESRVELEDEALVELELEELNVDELTEDTTASHFPNPAWQPVPQYALPLPQYEYCEQQSPYFPPEQVIPAGEAPYEFPQRALVVTLTFTGVDDGAFDEATRVEIEVLTRLDVVEVRAVATTPVQVPNDD
ncbi:hypothetical protein J4E80_006610 [Alternaria sp. BMP 0032]|nr:hypothetical protein J4E80_006610 [Alternaria sp. BMP 0032]